MEITFHPAKRDATLKNAVSILRMRQKCSLAGRQRFEMIAGIMAKIASKPMGYSMAASSWSSGRPAHQLGT